MTRNLDLALNAIAVELGTAAPLSGSVYAHRTPDEAIARLHTLMRIIHDLGINALGDTSNKVSAQLSFAENAFADGSPDNARMHLAQAVKLLQRHASTTN